MAPEPQIVFDGGEIARALTRMSREILENAGGDPGLALIGIRSRGVHLARRIARTIQELKGFAPPVGVLDITAYRDDRPAAAVAPERAGFETAVPVEGKTVVLVDDVIFRGRTIRAALDAVVQLGAPKRILVAVLVDRGARELPIRADVVGKNVEAGEAERVNVMLREADGVDQIVVARWRGRERTR
jgi:pyrimidine operon attenuation protein/uracil phosphoribosyltransferase